MKIPTQSEADLHLQVCQYLRLKHPTAIFRTDFASGIKMTMGQAAKHKRLQSSRAWPDIFIANPVWLGDGNAEPDIPTFWGLFIELKREGVAVYLKNGALTANPHIREQAAMLEQLENLGYCAKFAVGFEAATELIDWYLGGA